MQSSPHIPTNKKLDMFTSFKTKLIKRHTEKPQHAGIKKQHDASKLRPLIFISLLVFKTAVKRLEKYIIPIKALIPKRGKSNNISIILIAESPTEVKNVNFCWSSPFNIPSEMASRYIKGTMGDSADSKKPTLASL